MTRRVSWATSRYIAHGVTLLNVSAEQQVIADTCVAYAAMVDESD